MIHFLKSKLKKAIKENSTENIKNIIEPLNIILEVTRKAKKAGQRMENRLTLVEKVELSLDNQKTYRIFENLFVNIE
mgnify:CR=1 FL=1